MEISNLTSYWQKIQAAKSTSEATASTLTTTLGQAANTSAAYDMYLPSNETGDEILCSDNYNDIMNQTRSMMSPPSTGTTDSASKVSDTNAVTSSFSDLLGQISSTMCVNQDSILQTMDDLGLSASDLYTSDGMSKLVSALDKGASERGLQPVSNPDDSSSTLTSYATESSDSLKSTYGLSDDDYNSLMTSFDELLQQFLAQYETDDSNSDSTTETEAAASASSTTQV